MTHRIPFFALLAVVQLAGCGNNQLDADTYSLPDTGDAGPGSWLWGPDTAGGPCDRDVGCPCTNDTDCDTGKCAESVGGSICVGPCAGECGPHQVCVKLDAGGAKSSFCVDRYARLCRPCFTDSDCQVAGLPGGACVAHGGDGSFCATACDPTQRSAGCPGGFSCRSTSAAAGVATFQCLPDGDEPDDIGPCVCTGNAIASKAATPCGGTKAQGACPFYAACEAPGEAPVCKALGATTEICDQLDNDCDGETDEATCSDDEPCVSGSCVGGACKFIVAADDTACGDDLTDPCTAKGTCENGKCQLGASPSCDDANPCTDDACTPGVGCAHTPKEGAACDDGDTCTAEDTCSGATCQGAKPLNCDDGNPCTDDTCDPKKGCAQTPNSAPCSDANSCTAGTCKGGTCKLGATKGCQDNNPCTQDSCKAGKCEHKPAPGVSCDDGDACTEADSCAADKIGCIGGPAKPCDDANPCTTDSCDTKQGCVHKATAGKSAPCYEGPGGTQGVGLCVVGTKACTAQGSYGPCEGQVVPAPKEQCDGKDDDCDGKTDEGCAAAALAWSYAPTVVRGSGSKTRAELAQQTGPAGMAVDGKRRLDWSLEALWRLWWK